MKRSQINQAIDDALALLEQHDFHLPKWALWTKQQWRQAGAEADEIRRCQLGWDVTDFASGDFSAVGLTLFTIRNGLPGQQSQGGKDYCEKLMFVGPGQVTPCHFHWAKMEDIINRAGGVLVLQLNNARKDESIDTIAPVQVQVDGITTSVPAGGRIALEPGQSITLPPYLYHSFWAEQGKVLAGEVSRVNDDARDNRFLAPLPRFPAIEEDAVAKYVLCTEYAK